MMDWEGFSTKWFTLYYSVLAVLLILAGGYLIINKQKATDYLLEAANRENPPILFIRILKYLFLFTLPGLVLSFLPFSWIELIFTIWSLFVIYVAGIQLVRWKDNRMLIKVNPHLADIIHRSGAIMVSVGLALFLLAYLVITRQPVI